MQQESVESDDRGGSVYEYLPTENLCPEEELSAVDLRTSKSVESPDLSYYLPNTERTSKTQLEGKLQIVDGFYFRDPDVITSSSSKEVFVHETSDPLAPSEFTEDNYIDLTDSSSRCNYTHIPQSDVVQSVRYWSVGTNTDHATVANRASQTLRTETREASIQTDLYMSSFTGSLLNSNSNKKPSFVCCFCQRHYSTKSTYERHLRVHVKTNNRKIRARVILSSESVNQHIDSQNETPIIIQLPSSTKIKCDQCKKYFSSKTEKDAHDKHCIIEPFQMTQCPYCDIKYYHLGAMDEHVRIGHTNNKQSPRKNSYYCIFCDESFSTCYSFHLHLDQHLATS